MSDDQADLLSSMSDLELVQHLLADLHDDLPGKIARSRQLVDLSETLGTFGTMMFSGETGYAAWREARWCFIQGNFMATVLLCQALAEHTLAGFLHAAGLGKLPRRISFSDTLERCANDALKQDACFAMGVATRMLALPQFRLG